MDNILEYRRQFLLTRGPIDYFKNWQSFQLKDDMFLYSHPDLEIITFKDSIKQLVLLGLIFDPYDHHKTNKDILVDIVNGTSTFEDFIVYIKKYSGRFVFIYIDKNNTNILSDAVGLREVYYCTTQNKIICGSQPNLINTFSEPVLGISSDPEIQKYYNTVIAVERKGDAPYWIGDETYYNNIKHLLPNHYLNVESLKSYRYWPNKSIKKIDLDEAVNISCAYLEGILKSITYRYPSMMATTSGIDSRTLLAASKDVRDKIYFFINKEKHLKDNSPDISIPYNISKKLNFDFHIHEIENEVDENFKKIFLNNTFLSTERIITTIYNIYYKKLSNRINISGAGEIGRTIFGNEPKKLDGHYLAYLLHLEKSEYAINQCNKWLKEIGMIPQKYNLNTLTLFYWEQYCGNWGAIGDSESDIAIDEVDPYNSHFLFETFLSVNKKYIKYENNILFREMIKQMWPELLNFPFNPPTSFKERIKYYLKRIGIYIYPGIIKFRYKMKYKKF